jgi:hypothetical protein
MILPYVCSGAAMFSRPDGLLPAAWGRGAMLTRRAFAARLSGIVAEHGPGLCPGCLQPGGDVDPRDRVQAMILAHETGLVVPGDLSR